MDTVNWVTELVDDDLALCRVHAEQRSKAKRQYNVENHRVGPQTDFELDYIGVRGEFAFARLFNLPIHQITTDLLRGDGGHKDFDLLGVSISVKARPPNRRWFLMTPRLYPPKADVLVMMALLDEAHVLAKGWCTRQEFIDRHERPNLGRGPTCGVQDHALRPMDDFLYYMNAIMEAA
jgi:hypothetical protein